jgi:hypothetical protein
MRRVGRAAVSLVALGLLAAGAGMVGEPLSTGGPMHFDFNLPIGIFYLTCGVVLLEWMPTTPGWVYVLAALVVLSAAGRNFYRYPPIDDGAYFLLRYGRDALDNWLPPEPFAPMLAFDVAGWAAARAFGATGTRLVRLGVFVLGALASCAIYEMFMRGLIGGTGSRQLWLMLGGLALFAGGCCGWAGRSDAARVGLGLAAMTALVSLASWGLYAFTSL